MATILDSVTSHRMRARTDALIRQDPNLAALQSLAGRGFMDRWAHSVGVATDPELEACVPPLPPIELRQITAATATAQFLCSGFLDAECVFAEYQKHAISPIKRPAVLDFGCGGGRMMRFFSPIEWEIYGTEIHPKQVEWCNQNLAGTVTKVNGYLPPLQYDDHSFDFIYALSVFSHLPAGVAKAWLAELRRVLKPGGLAWISTHGEGALRTIEGSPVHQEMFLLTSAQAAALRERLPGEGLIFREYPAEVMTMAQVGPSYGNTFVDPEYGRREWAIDGLELMAYTPGGQRGWQDSYMLRRSP